LPNRSRSACKPDAFTCVQQAPKQSVNRPSRELRLIVISSRLTHASLH
jgi:hypothetical protein